MIPDLKLLLGLTHQSLCTFFSFSFTHIRHTKRLLTESAPMIDASYYLADAGHPGHSELSVTVQLQRSLTEEEVDLVVVSILTAAALPHQGRAHKVRLCTHTHIHIQKSSIRNCIYNQW